MFHAVDGIHHGVELLANHGFHIGSRHELHPGLNPAIGIDGAESFGHDLDLGLPEGAIQGVQLAVGVGNADLIQVDQGQGTNATAHQRLGCPGTNAAKAGNGHMTIRHRAGG